MLRLLVPLMLLAAFVLPASAKPLLKKTPADKGVDRALEFLSNTQNKRDGSWTAGTRCITTASPRSCSPRRAA